MSKLEIEFELTGLKLKIKGEKEEVPRALAAIQRQLGSMVQAAGAIAAGNDNQTGTDAAQPDPQRLIDIPVDNTPNARAKRTGGRRASGTGSRPKAEAIDFKHDAEKSGFPKQEWTTASKAMWLLYVLNEAGVATETTGPMIAATFNKHFKTFGTIHAANVHRDLGKEKSKTGWVNSDASKEPQTWYLLEAGKQGIAKLIETTKAPEA